MDYRQPIEPEIVGLVVVGLRAVKARIRIEGEGDPGTGCARAKRLQLRPDEATL